MESEKHQTVEEMRDLKESLTRLITYDREKIAELQAGIESMSEKVTELEYKIFFAEGNEVKKIPMRKARKSKTADALSNLSPAQMAKILEVLEKA